MTDNILHEIEKTVYLSSHIIRACSECSQMVFDNKHDIADQIHHYLDHGYKLLHVGEETTHNESGGLWHSTVALMWLPRLSGDDQRRTPSP